MFPYRDETCYVPFCVFSYVFLFPLIAGEPEQDELLWVSGEHFSLIIEAPSDSPVLAPSQRLLV